MSRLVPLRLRLRHILAWTGVVFFLLSALLSAVLSLQRQEQSYARMLQGRVRIASNFIADFVRHDEHILRRMLAEIADGNRDEILRRMETWRAINDPGDLFYMLDGAGRIRYVAQPYTQFLGLDFSHLEPIASRRAVSKVHQSLLSGKSVVSLLFPLPGGQLLVVERGLENIVPLMEHFRVGEMLREDMMFILSGDGTVVYHPDLELVRARHNLGFELKALSAPDPRGLRTFELRQRRFLGHAKELEAPLGWTLYYAVPYDVLLYSALRGILGQFLGLALFFGVLFALLGVFLDRYFSRPVRDIVQALDAYRHDGKHDAVPEGHGRRVLELTQIVRAVNGMTGKIHAAEAALLANEALFRTFTENSFHWDFWREPDGRLRYVAPACEQVTGYSAAEFYARPELLDMLIHPEDRPLWQNHVHELSAAGVVLPLDLRIVTKQGEVRWVRHFCRPIEDRAGADLGRRGSNIDITPQKAAEEQLRRNAFYDNLTGLANRALFMDHLEHALALSKRGDFQFAVLFLDLDRFKLVNDSLGHAAGDRLLVEIARQLREDLRPQDLLARLGGDEFVVLMEDVKGVRDAVQLAERLTRHFQRAFTLAQHEVFTSASVGIAMSHAHYHDAQEVLRDADTAMYRAKARGKDCCVVFDENMHAQALARLALETDLRHALDRGEFRVYYQPIVALGDGRVIGFEALVRWQHPLRGLLSPDEFVSISEETGLILPLGAWVLHEACRQIRAWQAQFPRQQPLAVNVNLSARQCSQPELVGLVARTLEAHGLPPACLKLEITESVLMENGGAMRGLLEELKSLGIHLCMDDFGTGYSSLSYLHHFPFDSLKIDQSFVRDMRERGKSQQIIHTILSLAQNMGLSVVAEGIETAFQLSTLSALGCEFGQGFLFSAPVAAEQAGRLLRDTPAFGRPLAEGDDLAGRWPACPGPPAGVIMPGP